MFVHPMSLNSVSDIDNKCIQMNAVDIRVSEIRLIDSLSISGPWPHQDQTMVISDEMTEHKEKSEPLCVDEDGFWFLNRGVYEFQSPHYVTVPEGYCGFLISRSSLNRNGVFVLSGLYDAGFHGYVGGTLYNISGKIRMKMLTRVCQLVMAKAETVSTYKGKYNHAKTNNDNSSDSTAAADNRG